MRQKLGKMRWVAILAAGITLGLIPVQGDSTATAGVLKNSVRVGDRSAMTLRKPPKPGARTLIRIAPLPGVAALPNGAAATVTAPAHAWFWTSVDPDIAAAGVARWPDLIGAVEVRRQSADPLIPADRLGRIAGAFRTELSDAARRHNVSEALLLAVIAVESAGLPRAVSPKGAQGLMQLMPGTAKRFAVEDSFDPKQNIGGGAAYLDFLLGRFQDDPMLALAGYNAGENAVDRHRGVPPYAETRDYVVKVLDALVSSRALCTGAIEGPRSPCVLRTMPGEDGPQARN